MSKMKIKVTSVSVSKKGRRYIQAEIVEGDTPRTDEVFEYVHDPDCEECKKAEEE